MTQFELDPVIHQPTRTRIVTYLVVHGVCDFTTLKKNLELTDGHLATHTKQLLGAKYIRVEKVFFENKPKTTYELTDLGRKMFSIYISDLELIIKQTPCSNEAVS
jgi:DNA-binding HxlR family transcriptional regulator